MADQSEKTKAKKVSWLPITKEEHQTKYTPKHKFVIKNKLMQMLSVTVCSGPGDFMHFKDKNGYPVVRKNVPNSVKQQYPISLFLRSKASEELKLADKQVVFLSPHLEALLREGRVSIKYNGKTVTYTDYIAEKNKIKGAK